MKPIFNMAGDKGARNMLDAVAKISAHWRSADLHGGSRHDEPKNNAQIADALRQQGRNFFETKETADAAAKAFARHTEIEAAKAKRITSPGGRANLAGKVWIAAMKAAMKAASKNIETANWTGGGSRTLSPDYASRKAAKVGFQYPIGKATGQLLNNLSAHVGNIRLQRA